MNASFEASLIDLFNDGDGMVNTYGMTYFAQPRITLQGSFNGEPIRGTGWFDHQWGDFDWLLDRETRKIIRGWKWFGINLDDGRDLILWQQINAETREVIAFFAILIRDQHPVSLSSFQIENQGSWYSHFTDSEYPSGFRILIPDLNAELWLPLAFPDQEIAVFGPMRAVWQGAGSVSGSINGISVKGSARCELVGYAYIHDIQKHFTKLKVRVDSPIAGFFPLQPEADHIKSYIGELKWITEPKITEAMISRPVWDLMSRSGKRWRPILAYQLLKALQIDPEPYEQAIFSLAELVHTGSLIIDDIQDSSLTRRGEESIHLRYGQDLAITAGNTLYFLPTLLIMDHTVLTKEQKHDILELMNRQLIAAHFGQSMDLYWSRQYGQNGLDPKTDTLILDRIRQMYSLKTGAPIQGLAEAAAIIANATGSVRMACGEFAQMLGFAFQIVDDIQNFNSTQEIGKTPGEDLIQGKITYVMATALKTISGSDREFLTLLIKSPELRSEADPINRGISIITQSGVLESCRKEAVELAEHSWELLANQLLITDAKVMIRLLIDQLMKPARKVVQQ